MSLNIKYELFVVHYVKSGGDIEKASKEVNTTPSTAKRWLKRDDVQDKIAELNSDIEKVLKINKTKVVAEYLSLLEEAKVDITKTGTLAKGCLDSVSKLMGYDAPVKVEHSMDLSSWLTNQSMDIIDVEIN